MMGLPYLNEMGTNPSRVPVEVPVAVGDSELNLTVRLVRSSRQDIESQKESDSNTNDTKYYSGFHLECNGEQVRCQRWTRSSMIAVPPGARVSVKTYQTMGYPSNDTKQTLLISGFCSATCHCPCLGCRQRKVMFTELRPEWQKEFDSPNEKTMCGTDAPLRKGENSNKANYERWQENTGYGMYHIKDQSAKDKENKLESASVSHPPLLFIPYEKETYAPMHAPQGVFTHMNDETRKRIQVIEDKGPWMVRVRSVRDEAVDMAKTDAEYNTLHKQSIQFDTDIKQKEKSKRYQQGRGEHNNQTLMVQYDTEIEALRSGKKQHSENTGYGQKTLLVKGANELLSAIKVYEDAPKKPKGPAQYAFDSAQRHYGNATFNAQHGGKEMAHKHGLQVLEQWSKVAVATVGVYTEDKNPDLRRALEELFQCVKRVADPLLVMSKILKSQEKIEGETLTNLRDAIVSLSKAWREVFEKANVFLKLHHIEFHVWVFVLVNQMYGRLSEEGFESCHPLINDVQQILAGMVSTQQRVKTFGRRMNVKSDDNVQGINDDVRNKLKGKPRGTYKKTARSGDDLEYLTCGSIVKRENGYLVLSSGGMIPESWEDVFLLVAVNKAPEEWHRVFNDDDDLAEEKKQKAKYVG